MTAKVVEWCSVFFIIYCFVLGSISGEKLILDVDAGADDAIAILLLLRFEKFQPANSTFEIIGITCTYGNTRLENVETNVLKTLTFAGRDDIPVYSGAYNGLIDPYSSDNFFGKDGFGDAHFEGRIKAKVDRSKYASIAIIDMVKSNSGNVSIVTLGPLTNLAMALSLEKNLTNHVKKFYIMGGSVGGSGNLRPDVEYNFGADPISNFIVLNAVKEEQVTLLPWETAADTPLTNEWRQNVFGKYDSPYIKFLNKIEKVRLQHPVIPVWLVADAMSVACLIEPNLIKASVVKNVNSVTSGEARGAALVDYYESTGKVRNTKIIQRIDHQLYKKMLIRYFTCQELPC